MAEDLDQEEGSPQGGEEEDVESSEQRGGSRRMLLLIAILTIIVLVLAAGAYLTGLTDPIVEMITGSEVSEEQQQLEQQGKVGKAVFYDLPEMVVNLNTGSKKQKYLKIRVSLELASKQGTKKVEKVMPRIKDNFQTYLRELRVEDLRGAAGMYRLREELMRRVNAAVEGARVKDVLFQEMLVQ
mgnify:CR=1 FL=1